MGVRLDERVLAAVWGFAEATLFFLVPDVYLSSVALRDVRRALLGCLWALAGAMVGGALMYLWGAHDLARAVAVLDGVPAVSRGQIAHVRGEIATSGLFAVLLGPLSGTPYKLYAVEAGALGAGLGRFLLVTIPARLVRFTLVTLLAAGLARVPPLRRSSPQAKRRIHALAWTAFYVFYFAVEPW